LKYAMSRLEHLAGGELPGHVELAPGIADRVGPGAHVQAIMAAAAAKRMRRRSAGACAADASPCSLISLS
jgi:hypothetical protein